VDVGGDNEGVSVEMLRLDLKAVRSEYMDEFAASAFGVVDVDMDVRKARMCSRGSCRASVCSGVRPAVVARRKVRMKSLGDRWSRCAWASSYHSGMRRNKVACPGEFGKIVEPLWEDSSEETTGRQDSTLLTRMPSRRRTPGSECLSRETGISFEAWWYFSVNVFHRDAVSTTSYTWRLLAS
jgi:hypothetical protein